MPEVSTKLIDVCPMKQVTTPKRNNKMAVSLWVNISAGQPPPTRPPFKSKMNTQFSTTCCWLYWAVRHTVLWTSWCELTVRHSITYDGQCFDGWFAQLLIDEPKIAPHKTRSGINLRKAICCGSSIQANPPIKHKIESTAVFTKSGNRVNCAWRKLMVNRPVDRCLGAVSHTPNHTTSWSITQYILIIGCAVTLIELECTNQVFQTNNLKPFSPRRTEPDCQIISTDF
jgi:hypothetical protein